MASGPHWNAKRGTWNVQYWDGRWRRVVVVRKPPGYRPGDRAPKKPPPEAYAALARLAAIEEAARSRRARTKGPPVGLADFLADHVNSYENPLSRESVRIVVDQFVAWCASRQIEAVDQVTTEVCEAWLDEQARAHMASTVERKRAHLSGAWSRRGKRRNAPNPWKDIRGGGKVRKRKRGSWTPEQFERLLAASRPYLRDLLIVGVNTGLRIAALMDLRWGEVEWNHGDRPGFGWIRVPAEKDKAGKGYGVPISEALHDLLARRRATTEGDHVLCGAHGRPLKSRTNTGTAIRRACARAGLPRPDSPNHHMRRTFGRWAVLGHLTGKPVPLYVVSRWLGHADVRTTQIYLDVKEEDSTRFMLGDP
jgi:integrase